MQNNYQPVQMGANNDGDAVIVLVTFIPLLVMLIRSICNDQSFEFEC